jgi:hypothetical protein
MELLDRIWSLAPSYVDHLPCAAVKGTTNLKETWLGKIA